MGLKSHFFGMNEKTKSCDFFVGGLMEYPSTLLLIEDTIRFAIVGTL